MNVGLALESHHVKPRLWMNCRQDFLNFSFEQLQKKEISYKIIFRGNKEEEDLTKLVTST